MTEEQMRLSFSQTQAVYCDQQVLSDSSDPGEDLSVDPQANKQERDSTQMV